MIDVASSFTLTDSVASVTLNPTFGYSRGPLVNRSYQRGQSGSLSSYTIASSQSFVNIPIDWLDQADAKQINSWWSDLSSLWFSTGNETISVNITNQQEPFFRTREGGNVDIFQGLISLREN